MRGFLRLILFVCAAAVLNALPARGDAPPDENRDLELIPQAVRQDKGGAPAGENKGGNGRGYLENALTGWSRRDDLRVPVPVPVPGWQNRTSADFDYSWELLPHVRGGLSDRVSVFAANTIAFPSAATLRNDFREGVVSWEPAPRRWLEAGRINVKNGTAVGFNPTDFFKARTTVNLASIDPSALRENRLGTVMVRGETIWDKGAVSVAFAPKLQNPTPLFRTPASLDPLFGQTNAENRFLAALSYDVPGVSPQLLVFHDDIGTHLGANFSRVMTSGIVAYLEWSGVRAESLTGRALSFGEKTGTLPPGAPVVPQGRGTRFLNDLSVGGTWTALLTFTVNLEYHYHQAGFSGADFDRWIALGRDNAALAPELWYIRQYAADRQEPLMQHQFFLRLDWPDAVPSRLNLGGVLFVSPHDGSLLTQLSAQYFVSREWTVGAYLAGTTGGRGTVMGSLPWRASGVLQVVRYL